MKIKTKKAMQLPTLIQWAWDNSIKNQIFRADKQLMNIKFDEHGDFRTYGFAGNGTTFTVEVEELITEDTVIPKLIEVYLNDANNTFAEPHRDRTIKQIQDEGGCKSLAFYTINDDLTMTLIWRDGKLVE